MARSLLLPLTISTRGDMRTLEQGSTEELSQSVALLVDTRIGERRSVPEYGTVDRVFGRQDLDELTDAVQTWEERVASVDLDFTTTDRGAPSGVIVRSVTSALGDEVDD